MSEFIAIAAFVTHLFAVLPLVQTPFQEVVIHVKDIPEFRRTIKEVKQVPLERSASVSQHARNNPVKRISPPRDLEIVYAERFIFSHVLGSYPWRPYDLGGISHANGYALIKIIVAEEVNRLSLWIQERRARSGYV
jgi:hypothetical protein